MQHFEDSNDCPKCGIQVHETNPLEMLRYDFMIITTRIITPVLTALIIAVIIRIIEISIINIFKHGLDGLVGVCSSFHVFFCLF